MKGNSNTDLINAATFAPFGNSESLDHEGGLANFSTRQNGDERFTIFTTVSFWICFARFSKFQIDFAIEPSKGNYSNRKTMKIDMDMCTYTTERPKNSSSNVVCCV